MHAEEPTLDSRVSLTGAASGQRRQTGNKEHADTVSGAETANLEAQTQIKMALVSGSSSVSGEAEHASP